MKKTIKFLSFLLALTMIMSLMTVVVSAEAVDPTVTLTKYADDYAWVSMSTTAKTSGNWRYYCPSALAAHINTPGLSKINATYGLLFESYVVPDKGNVTGLTYGSINHTTGMKNGYVEYCASNTGFDFFRNYEDGAYGGDSEEYASIFDYVSGAWYNETRTTLTTDDFYSVYYKGKYASAQSFSSVAITSTALSTFKELETDEFAIMFRGLSATNQGMYLPTASGTYSLTITYTNNLIVDYLKTATSADDLKAKIEAFKTTGLPLSDTVNSDAFVLNSVYEEYTDAEKTKICENLYPNLANCIAWDDFKSALYAAMSASPLILLDSALSAGAYTGTIDEVEYTSDNSIVLYGTAIGDSVSYGFMLSQLKDEVETGRVKVVPQLVADDGCFAIRVIGEGITAGTYKAWPFLTVGGTTTENTEDVETITVTAAAVEETPAE